jgi:hypothetical protein
MNLHQLFQTRNRMLRAALAASLISTLAACGGGGGGGSNTSSQGGTSGSTSPTGSTSTSSSTTSTATSTANSQTPVTLSGQAVDNPIPNATITITAGAPLGDAGATTIGTVTADSTGGYTVTATLPGTAEPIFANATDPTNAALVLSSYLGQSTTLAATGTLTDANLPDLDITPVTTAALAVYSQVSGGYSSLTQTSYANTLANYGSDIVTISAAIKAVGDSLCTPSSTVSSVANLASSIASQSNLTSGSSTTLSTAASILGTSCVEVLATLPQTIQADPTFGPQLSVSLNSSTAQAQFAGTWQLQGVIAEAGLTLNFTSLNNVTAPNPASVFVDSNVTISATGQVASTDGNVTGTLIGNSLVLTIISGTQTYTVHGSLGAVPAALVSGGTAYAMAAGGENTASKLLTNFNAVLAPVGATPVWNGISTSSTSNTSQGITCASGQPMLLDGSVGYLTGIFGECVVPGATGWTMAAPTANADAYGFLPSAFAQAGAAITPEITAPSWTAASSATSFVLSAPSANAGLDASGSSNPTSMFSGTAYYVMGAQSIVFAASGFNDLLNIESNPLTHLSPVIASN